MPKYDYVRYFDFSINDNPINERFDAKKLGYFACYEPEDAYIKRNVSPQVAMLDNMLHCVKYMYPNIDYTIVIDTDEFINIKNGITNINDFLDKFFPKINSSCQIQMCFYSSDDIYYEDKPCRERFNKGKFLMNRDLDPGCHKIIINNKHWDFPKINIMSAHYCSLYINGFRFDRNIIELQHFFTKSLEEWISKFNRNNDRSYIDRFKGALIKHFFYDFSGNKFNEITEEKMKAIPELLKKYNIDYDPSTEEIDDEIRELYKKYNNL